METEKNTSLLTDNELRHIALNAMGRASEAGSAPVFRFGFASNIHSSINLPDNNSGLTLGYMQVDFGAHPGKIKPLISDYNKWANENNYPLITDINEAERLLTQNRNIVLTNLLPAYNEWANKNNQSELNLKTDTAKHITDTLKANAEGVVKLQNNHPERKFIDVRNTELGKNFNTFLSSEAGHDAVIGLQEAAYKDIENNMKSVMNNSSFEKMSRDEQIYVLGVIGKISNQAGPNSNKTKSMINIITGAESEISFDTFKTQSASIANSPAYVKGGYEHTVKGVNVFNKLYADQSELGKIFREQLEKDPYATTGQEFKESPQEQLIDSMFRYSGQVDHLIKALDEGGNYQIRPSYSTSATGQALASEVYTIGIKDGVLFTIDHEGGNAHKMNNQGQWIAFDNDKNPLVHRDANNRWTTSPKDLALDSKGYPVLELQEKLNALNPNGTQITTNGKDSVYDQATVDQVKAFQEAHGLTATGQYNNATRSAIDAQLNEQNKHLPFVRTNSSQKPEQQITNKLTNIQALNEKLNDPSGEKLLSEADQAFFGRDILLTSHEGDMAQLGGYLAKLGLVEENATTENILSAINQFERTNNLSQDNTNWSETLSALKDQYITHQKDEVTNEIQTERQAMAQLELDRITDINEQQTKLTTDKAELTDDIALKGAQIIALQGLQENFANNASNDNVANNPLSETAMSLLNKNTLNLNNDKTGEVTDLKQLQTVLKEEGYLKGKADGLWGNDTEQALAKATGLTQDNVKALVTTDLGQDGNGQVIDPKIMESGRLEALRSQYLESKVSQLTLSKTELENKSMGIDDKLSILDTQRPSIIEQNIVSEQLKINQLQENIRDYDKTHIEPLTELQAQLSNHINDPTPYQSVKDELSAANISLLTSEQQSLMDSSALLKQNGKTNNIDNVQSVQSFLIEKGYLDATWKDKQGVEHPSNDGNFGGGTHKAIVAYQTEKGLNADGVVGKDFRVAMKEDIYSNLSTDDLNQRIGVEMAARIEGKETKIAELASSINQSELRIGQLQSEQKTMIATQQSLQQSQESKEPVVTVEGKQNTLDTAFNLSTQRSDVSIESGAKGAVLNVGNQQCSMDFCKVKNFEHYANGNNTLLGKLNDDDQFKIFHRSGGKLNEVATIDDFSKQNLVALEESVRTQGLAQGRNQDQGREA